MCQAVGMVRGIHRSPPVRAQQIVFRGTSLGRREFARIQKIIDAETNPSRQRIAEMICRRFGWRRPNGARPIRACCNLLVRLERIGVIRLPAPRRKSTHQSRARPLLDNDFLLGPPTDWPGALDSRALLEVRPLLEPEREGFRAYMQRYHYLGDSPLVGESLRYGAWLDGELVALLGWAGATLHNGPRDGYIGWDEDCRRERLHLVSNNSRFLVLPWVRQKNLASRVLGANLRRLSADWQAAYGHPVLLAETFVDQKRFRGTCYRASNWIYVGQTKGWSRHGSQYYEHGQPKAVFVYLLNRNALKRMGAPFSARGATGGGSVMTLDVEKLPLEGEDGLFSVLATISDLRKRRGIRHPLQSILAMATCAVLAGQRNFAAMAEWASDQSKEVLLRLGSRYGRPPSERTFRRVLKRLVDVEEVDEKLGLWVARQQQELKGMGVAIDGKTVRGSRDGDKKAVHLLSAVVHGSGVVVAQTRVPGKTNEIKCVEPLLEDLDIEGAVVTADALLTQRDIARYIVEEKQADYVLPVKDNQPTLRQDIEDFFKLKEEEERRLQNRRDLGDEDFPP